MYFLSEMGKMKFLELHDLPLIIDFVRSYDLGEVTLKTCKLYLLLYSGIFPTSMSFLPFNQLYNKSTSDI